MLKHYELHSDLNKDKLFRLTPPPALDISSLPVLPENWLNELAILCYGDAAKEASYKNPFNQHLLNLSPQSELSEKMQLIYRRLNGDLNKQLGVLTADDRAVIVCTLIDDIGYCTAGFTNRVNNIYSALHRPQSIDHLLYKVRTCLVEKEVAPSFVAHIVHDGVHVLNSVTYIAFMAGLGIQPNFQDDPHGRHNSYGDNHYSAVQDKLKQVFETRYTPFSIPDLLAQQLHGILVTVGYVGRKTVDSGGYVVSETEQMTKLLKRFLLHRDVDDENACTWNKYFILASEDENSIILDINWQLVRQYFFEALIKQGYFLQKPQCRRLLDYPAYRSLYPDNLDECAHEANFIAVFFEGKNYPQLFEQLLFIKNNFPDYCKKLVKNQLFFEKGIALAHYLCKNLKKDRAALVDFFVEMPDLYCNETIPIIQQLFLQQNSEGNNALMLAVHLQLNEATRMLWFLFFIVNKGWLSNDTIQQLIQQLFLQQNSDGDSALMLAARFQPALAKQILLSFTEKKDCFPTDTIQQLFLQQNSADYNALMLAARFKPDIVGQILQLFTKNKDCFSTAVILRLFLQKNGIGWNVLILAEHTSPQISRDIFNFLVFDFNGYPLSETSEEKEIAQFLFAQVNEWERQDLRRKMPSNTALLLLSFFDKDCVRTPTCLAKITPVLFEYYLNNLSTRADKGITPHSNCFFGCPVDDPTYEEMQGATALKEIQSKDYSREDVLALQQQYPILRRNGTLGKLLGAFLQIASLTPAYSSNTPRLNS
jgi:hypothetical protein